MKTKMVTSKLCFESSLLCSFSFLTDTKWSVTAYLCLGVCKIATYKNQLHFFKLVLNNPEIIKKTILFIKASKRKTLKKCKIYILKIALIKKI